MAVSRGGRHYPTPPFKAWREQAACQLVDQGLAYKRYAGPLCITVFYVPGDLRRRDLTSVLDVLFHLLEYLEVIVDDSQFEESHYYKQPLDRMNPKLLVIIKSIKPEGALNG